MVLFFFIILSLLPLSVQAARFCLADSATVVCLTLQTADSSAIAQLLSSSRAHPQRAVKQLLDSLGYFSPHRDTASVDTITLLPGPRASLSSLEISSPAQWGWLANHQRSTPLAYSAAEIRERAQRLLHDCARHGYPFATLRTELIATDSCNGASYKLLFSLQPDKAARFDNAVFSGATTTRATQLARDIRFASGQPFDIVLVEQTLERLRSRDYIAQVLTPGPQLSASVKESDSALGVTIPFVVTDRSGLGLDGAVAMERSAPGELYLKGNLEFSLLNLLGVGDKLHLRYEGDRQWQRLEVAVGKAYLGAVPLFCELGFGLELAKESFAHMQQRLQLLYELQTRWQAGITIRGQESAVESTLTQGGSSQSWKVYTTELVVKRIGKALARDVLSSSLYLTGGSGFVTRQDERYTRWLGSFSAQLHLPLPRTLALRMSSTVQALLSDEPSLTPAERYRVGGARTVRGYSDNQFAFRTTAFGQFECLWYVAERGALFAFVDGGAGMRGEQSAVNERAQWLLGYGMGIRMPSKIGTATIAWARSREDRRSLGRVHLRFQNLLADEW